MKLKAKKGSMTQIWKGDKVSPVTALYLEQEEKGETVVLSEGEKVTLVGKSKGRGFQGVVKRHGFSGGPKTHGQKDRHRAPGSIGATAPQRVIPGRKMAGHMGTRQVTLKERVIERIDEKEKRILVKGPVPGMKGSTVTIHKDE